VSNRCQTWVFDHSEVTGNDRLVLLALADEANDDGTNAYPSIDRLAHKARANKRTTLRSIQRLEEAGAIRVQRPERKGRGRFNTYVVVMDQPENGDTVSPIQPEPEKVRNGDTKVRNGDTKVRNGAQPYLDGSRPIDPLTQEELLTTPVDLVFSAWLTSTKKTARTVLDSKRRSLITAALRTHPLDDVLDAVRGWENSPHHRGENAERKVWNDLGLLLRDAGKIEQFRDLARGPRLTGKPGRSVNGYRPPAIDDDRSAPSRVLRSEDL
jgi:hypothetical protein